jgi:hypothetical protein
LFVSIQSLSSFEIRSCFWYFFAIFDCHNIATYVITRWVYICLCRQIYLTMTVDIEVLSVNYRSVVCYLLIVCKLVSVRLICLVYPCIFWI